MQTEPIQQAQILSGRVPLLKPADRHVADSIGPRDLDQRLVTALKPRQGLALLMLAIAILLRDLARAQLELAKRDIVDQHGPPPPGASLH